MNMMSKGSAWLSGKLQGFASQAAFYQRGQQCLPIQVTVGDSEFTRRRADDISNEHRVVDFLFPASSIHAVFHEPSAGDFIETDYLGEKRLFEVLSPGGDEPAWRYSDPHRNMIRVHTVEAE
jgi:hypothetical protein